jgi:hypothetical protein
MRSPRKILPLAGATVILVVLFLLSGTGSDDQDGEGGPSDAALVRSDLAKVLEKLDKMEAAATAAAERCSAGPIKGLAFAKTHKTGSSTLQNIFLRFGVKHDLTFAFPANSWMFNVTLPMNASLVTEGPFRNLGFDLFVSHSNWRYGEVRRNRGRGREQAVQLLHPRSRSPSFSHGTGPST